MSDWEVEEYGPELPFSTVAKSSSNDCETPTWARLKAQEHWKVCTQDSGKEAMYNDTELQETVIFFGNVKISVWTFSPSLSLQVYQW